LLGRGFLVKERGVKVAIVGPGGTHVLYDEQIWTYEPTPKLDYTLEFRAPHSYRTPDGRMDKFPAQELLKDFGPYWFNSPVSWLIPFALVVGARQIGIYGVGLNSEQRLAMQHWICTCEQLRVPVYVDSTSKLLEAPVPYGF
jgi:hypothetical protein